jgi:uncharacterized protein (UPF0248 family)
MPVCNPGRIAYQNISLLLGPRQPQGSHQIAQHERPDAIAPRVVQLARAFKGIRHRGGVLSGDALDPEQRSSDLRCRRALLEAVSECLQTIVEARLVLGKASGHMEGCVVRHGHNDIARVADLTQIPPHRVAEIRRDMELALARSAIAGRNASSQVTRAMITATGCTSRPRTCWTHAEIAAARGHPAASAAASFNRIA